MTTPPNLLATLLSGSPPVPVLPSGSVRAHRMDDAKTSAASSMPGSSPGFSVADKMLIRRLHGYMPHLQLLGVLNERLACDTGKGGRFTIDQLRAEINSTMAAVPVGDNDWGSLRKLLAKARRDGVLGLINEQVINDFAVVYSLNQKQVMTLKDILLNEEDSL